MSSETNVTSPEPDRVSMTNPTDRASSPTRAAGPAARRSTSWRTRLTAVAFAVVASVGLVVAPAQADTGSVGGCPPAGCVTNPTLTYSNTPGGAILNVDCTAGRLAVATSASAQAGYANGQWITYRTYLVNKSGQSITSTWAAATAAPYLATVSGATVQTPLTNLPSMAFNVVRGTTWTVYAQYAWHNGSTWTYSAWVGPTSGYMRGGAQRYYIDCYT